MRFKVLTIGCKVNQYESRSVEEELARRGGVRVGEGDEADLVVINTCTVTSRSDVDARALIRRQHRENPGARVVVAGCYAALSPEEALETGADLVLASADKGGLAALALSEQRGIYRLLSPPKSLEPEPVNRFTGRKRAYLKVQDGCECFCAYCIVPYARGPSRSLALPEVIRGIDRLAAAGHSEVVLTGIHLGLWGRDLTPASNVCDLLETAENSAIKRIRLSSIEPLEVTDELLALMARSKKVCPHLHVPLQSGSDRILAAMGRPYGAALARERLDAAFAALPGLCMGLDIITGFPGETEREFRETVEFLESLPFCHLHVFPFSPRRGTRAFDMGGQIERTVSTARAAELRALSEAKREEFHRRAIGTGALVLPETKLAGGILKGHTFNYLEVAFPWEGEMPAVEIPVDLLGWDGVRLTAKARG